MGKRSGCLTIGEDRTLGQLSRERTADAESGRADAAPGTSVAGVSEKPQTAETVRRQRAPLDAGAKILVVDDEKAIIDIIRINFEMRGDTVYGCDDSTRGLEMALEKQPDVILLDLLMPERNGWEVLQELKGNDATRHIPVIICTVMKQGDIKDKAAEAGAADYLAKPFDSTTLIAVVERALESS